MNRFSIILSMCLLSLIFLGCSDDGGNNDGNNNNNQPDASDDVQVLPTGTETSEHSYQFPMPIEDDGKPDSGVSGS